MLPNRGELLERLDKASRAGSVTATKLLLEELRREEAEQDDAGFDELDNVTPLRRGA
jgi:hypothetical protein